MMRRTKDKTYIPKSDIIPLQRKFAWIPKRMYSQKLVWLGFYYEEISFFSTGKTEYWKKKLYAEREYFFKKLKN